jgi:hypothetical protein
MEIKDYQDYIFLSEKAKTVLQNKILSYNYLLKMFI